MAKNDFDPVELSGDEMTALLLSGAETGEYEPLGLYYRLDGETWVAVDNSTGNAWTEEFKTKAACVDWLTLAEGLFA